MSSENISSPGEANKTQPGLDVSHKTSINLPAYTILLCYAKIVL